MSNDELLTETVRLIFETGERLKKLTNEVEKLCSHSAEPKKTALTLEKVRGILAAKSQDGYTEEVRSIIAKHGAARLSEIAPEKYEEVLRDAEVLGSDS